ncbi:hypothetical protein K435DRAFT_857294 [Dendrothele bispora CBS 962.96]|uniref:HECT domain-containing protein n=1 Tax=Dendrothele bispora (strain CBS 962.96) TaxID=1314807 RepID=A0A4S8M649_DENBC|nr:hypothetical protein K435DRAFT_857294 [Dendrothele bispora CBS 962.96]
MNNPSGHLPPPITPQYLAAMMAFLQQNGQLPIPSTNEPANVPVPGTQSVAVPASSPALTPAPMSNGTTPENAVTESLNSATSLPPGGGFASFSVQYAGNQPNGSGSSVVPVSQPTWPASSLPNRIQPYISPNVSSQGYPNISTVANSQAASASSAPMVTSAGPASFSGMQSLGFQSLGPQVNQQRLSHAARAQSSSTRPARRGRGPAQQPPSAAPTPVPKRTINDIFYFDSVTGERRVRLRCDVLPNAPPGTRLNFLTDKRIQLDTFLHGMDLTFNEEFSPSTTFSQLVTWLVAKLQGSRFNWTLSPPKLALNGQPLSQLRLMEYMNHGRTYGGKPVGMKKLSVLPEKTLDDLALTPTVAGRHVLKHVIVDSNRLLLRFIVDDTLTGVFTLKEAGFDDDDEMYVHDCLGEHFWLPYHFGDEYELPKDQWDKPCECQDIDDVTDILIPNQSTGGNGNDQSIPATHTSGASDAVTRIIPPTLWGETWTPPVVESSELTSLQELPKYVYSLIHPQRSMAPYIDCVGNDVFEAGRSYVALVKEAVAKNDFCNLLSPRRMFQVETGNVRNSISLGAGVEAEILTSAWSIIQNHSSQYWTPLYGDFCGPAVSVPMLMAGTVSQDRLQSMTVLGALTGLMLLNGLYPDPLSPLFLQFALHDGDVRSLTPSLVQEWAPDLYGILKEFLRRGPTGDLSDLGSFFIAHMGYQVETIGTRDLATHNSTASLMLYRAAIGPEPPLHPELQAFIKGLRLPCKDKPSFDFTKVIKSYGSGTDSFLSVISISHVTSYRSIEGLLTFIQQPEQVEELSNALGSLFDLESLFVQFLLGTGAPVPSLWNEAQGAFHPKLNVEGIDKVWFRPQMLLWSITGSPRIRGDLSDSHLKIELVGNDDDEYCANENHRPAMLAHGQFSIKTCSMQARIPCSYLKSLITATRASGEDVVARVSHYFLVELVNAIGRHSQL